MGNYDSKRLDKRSGHYKMSNGIKLLFSCMDKANRAVWRKLLIDADYVAQNTDRAIMKYEGKEKAEV